VTEKCGNAITLSERHEATSGFDVSICVPRLTTCTLADSFGNVLFCGSLPAAT